MGQDAVVVLESKTFEFSHIASLVQVQPKSLPIQAELYSMLLASRASCQDS